MQLRVELHGLGPSGPFQENAYTVNVSRSGARLTGSRYSQHPGDTVELRRGKDKARFQVIWVGEPGTPVHGQVGVRSLEPAKNIWSAPLPAPKPVSDMAAPAYPAEAPARPSITAFSGDAFSPSVESAPSPSNVAATDASGESLYTRTPFVSDDENLQSSPVEEQGDTVHYGPELTPEQYLVAHAPPPLHKRPILYAGLAFALIAGLGLGWLRSRGAGDETSSAVSSAEASAAAPSAAEPDLTKSEPVTPPPSVAPAQTQPVPAQTQPAAKPAPKKPEPVETASRTRPAPTKSAPAASSAFAVQVGAYSSAATAQSLAKSLASRYDRKGTVDSVASGGKTLHRVRLSSRSEADARALVARIHREQNLKAIVVRPD